MLALESELRALRALTVLVAVVLLSAYLAWVLGLPPSAPGVNALRWTFFLGLGLGLVGLTRPLLTARGRWAELGWLAAPLSFWGAGYGIATRVVQYAPPHRYVDPLLREADRRIFALVGIVPPHWPLGGPAEELANVFYLSFYFAIPAGAYWLWRRGDFAAAQRYALAVVSTFAACALLWVLFPAGGWHPTGSPTGPGWGPFTALAHGVYAAFPHYAAAFPSSHVAVSTAAAAVLVRRGAPRALWAWVLGVAFATVYGQYHYLVDAPTGFAVGWLAARAALGTRGVELELDLPAPHWRLRWW